MNRWTKKIRMLSAMAAVGCLPGIGQAGAWNQADLDKLLETKQCKGCDLSGDKEGVVYNVLKNINSAE